MTKGVQCLEDKKYVDWKAFYIPIVAKMSEDRNLPHTKESLSQLSYHEIKVIVNELLSDEGNNSEEHSLEDERFEKAYQEWLESGKPEDEIGEEKIQEFFKNWRKD